jgi:hypothetical protein
LCCKTIFTAKMSNIDSRTSTIAQRQFKTHLSRIRLLLVRSVAKSFATQSARLGPPAMSALAPLRAHRRAAATIQVAPSLPPRREFAQPRVRPTGSQSLGTLSRITYFK